MKVVIGADKDGFSTKNFIKAALEKEGFDVIDVSPDPAKTFVDSALAVTDKVMSGEAEKGIMFDRYGIGSTMASSKVKGMVSTNVGDETTAHQTAEHNDAKAIAIGTGLIGPDRALALVDRYVHAKYADGRHQIRINMLKEMI